MEFASGGDLQAKIQENIKNKTLFPETEIWKALIHMASGLQTLHSMKILHRDLKCANVFLSADGIYKLGKKRAKQIGYLYSWTFIYNSYVFTYERWHECVKGCQKRISLHLNWYTILCFPRGMERLTVWYKKWYLVAGLCALRDVHITSTIQSQRHGWTLQKSLKRRIR